MIAAALNLVVNPIVNFVVLSGCEPSRELRWSAFSDDVKRMRRLGERNIRDQLNALVHENDPSLADLEQCPAGEPRQ